MNRLFGHQNKEKTKQHLKTFEYTTRNRLTNDHLFGKELFIRFTASAFRKLSAIYVFSYFAFGFEGRMRDLIVSVPDYYLAFNFENLTFFLCFYVIVLKQRF